MAYEYPAYAAGIAAVLLVVIFGLLFAARQVFRKLFARQGPRVEAGPLNR